MDTFGSDIKDSFPNQFLEIYTDDLGTLKKPWIMQIWSKYLELLILINLHIKIEFTFSEPRGELNEEKATNIETPK